MISMDVRHPDIFEFATVKQDLSKVTGANISIQLRDDFMQAVQADDYYILRFPCNWEIPKDFWTPDNDGLMTDGNGRHWKKIKARDLWNVIIKSAHGTAEPGLMFLDKHWDYSPDGVYPQYRGITTNPCGEIFMQEYDACRLLALNLFSFVDEPFTEKASVNLEKLYQIAYEQQRLADNLIDLELEHIQRILDKLNRDPESEEIKQREINLWKRIQETAASSRRTGSGFTALADTLAACNVKYDSDDALSLIELIMRTKFKAELDCTIDLAIQRGTFKGWDWSKEYEVNSYDGIGKNKFYQELLNNFRNEFGRMLRYGRRNVSWSTVAPTGSVSILTQTTSGLEPLFQPYYIRRKKVNPGDQGIRIDFTDQNGDCWQEYPVLHPKFKDWMLLTEPTINNEKIDPDNWTKNYIDGCFKMSPWYGSTANDIDWHRRIEIQSIIQKYTTHSISTTLNLPNSVTLEEVSDIYMKSWEHNLKGQTIYRDGCRTGVMITQPAKSQEIFEYHDAPKRPKTLECDVYNVITQGENYHVFVGLYDNKPYEVFARRDDMKLDRGEPSGTLTKMARGAYRFESEQLTFENILANMTNNQEAYTRLISTSLRHGADIKFIVEQLQKAEGELNSFAKVIARVLKKYIPEGAKSTLTCENCGSHNVVFQEGCNVCMDCGSSKCG